jgi:adapter protein MecA 1/2
LKIEKLTDDKLKITLSIDDLEERNINLHSFMYNSPESQDLFWELLQKAEKECGFNVDNSMIYVEASTTGSGNFTLLVTKTKESAPVIEKISKPKKITNGNFRLKRKTAPLKHESTIYIFESFDDICSFCSLCDVTILHSNKLYSMNENYYLKTDYIPYNMILDYATIAKNPNLLEARLNEYGKVVIEENALQTIAMHFGKKKRSKKNKKL